MADVEIKKLNNGLTCYLDKQINAEASTVICLCIKAGAIHEKAGEKGWLHFLEHLLIYMPLYMQEKKKGYFRAFDYAYTSFCETTYIFKAIDPTMELLEDSLITVKEILKGIFLNRQSFGQTREDVLAEYWSFTQKDWYIFCAESLNDMGVSLPIGIEDDIKRADYSQLKKLFQKYYYPENAAIILTSPHEVDDVWGMIEKVFEKNNIIKKPIVKFKGQSLKNMDFIQEENLFLLLAWYPRYVQYDLERLKKYIEIAILARIMEIALEINKSIDKAECYVEIFNDSYYIFKLKIDIKKETVGKQILEILMSIKLTENLFDEAKKIVKEQLKQQYSMKGINFYSQTIIECCKEHFLFREPLVGIADEYKKCCEILEKLVFKNMIDDLKILQQQFVRYMEKGMSKS